MSLFLHGLDDLLPVLTKIINKSLSEGQFPNSYKNARVMPLIKKPSLDSEDMKNYRPISDLRFYSKLVERVAVSQIQSYLKDNSLQSSKQSAFPFWTIIRFCAIVLNKSLTISCMKYYTTQCPEELCLRCHGYPTCLFWLIHRTEFSIYFIHQI